MLSPNSKCVFEKPLIEQYVEQHGVDPITKDALSVEQLITIAQTPQQYALANSTNSSTLNSNYSIPNLLSTLQNEWDAIMLENFQLRQQLDTCKKELSTALYQYDAAVRVAGRACMERDEVKRELGNLTKIIGGGELLESTSNLKDEEGQDSKDGDDENKESNFDLITDGMIEDMIERSQSYVAATKKVKATPRPVTNFVTSEETTLSKEFSQLSSLYVGGILLDNKWLTTFGSKGTFYVWNPKSYIHDSLETMLSEIRTKHNATECNLTCIYPLDENSLIFGTSNGASGTYDHKNQSFTILANSHEKLVSLFHQPHITPTSYITISENGTVQYISLINENSVRLNEYSFSTNFSDIHKDGLLIVLANDSQVIVRSVVKPQDSPVFFPHDEEEDGPILDVKFGLNGYWMFVTCAKSIKVFHLGKSPGTLAVQPLRFGDSAVVKGFDTDHSGKYLFVLVEQLGKFHIHWYAYHKPDKQWVLKWTKNCEKDVADDVIVYTDISYVSHGDHACLKLLTPQKLVTVDLD